MIYYSIMFHILLEKKLPSVILNYIGSFLSPKEETLKEIKANVLAEIVGERRFVGKCSSCRRTGVNLICTNCKRNYCSECWVECNDQSWDFEKNTLGIYTTECCDGCCGGEEVHIGGCSSCLKTLQIEYLCRLCKKQYCKL
jgi:hypothetical protein